MLRFSIVKVLLIMTCIVIFIVPAGATITSDSGLGLYDKPWMVDGLQSSRSAQGSASQVSERIDNLLSSMACKAAIKAGDRLAPEEMLALLSQMRESPFFSHCPHGRPVVKMFTNREIEKWFHRI